LCAKNFGLQRRQAIACVLRQRRIRLWWRFRHGFLFRRFSFAQKKSGTTALMAVHPLGEKLDDNEQMVNSR
jgi:hypothetical protein